MTIPSPVYDPPFNITRASHVVLTVHDLAGSRRFYTEVIGLAVSAEEGDTLYLRGLEEACHHSLVLKRRSGEPMCERVGFRVFTEDDLTKAHAYYTVAGLPATFVDAPHQGRTLHVTDPFGTPLEFCASMEVMPRLLTQFHLHKGGRAHRLDHFQILVPDVQGGCEFYMQQGFRLSEYVVTEHGEALVAAFLQRKGNPHDLVLFNQSGPRIIISRLRPSMRTRCCTCVTSPAISVTGSRWSAVPAATGLATRNMSISATRTATASSFSPRTIRSWISRMRRCAGIRTIPCANRSGVCPRNAPGSRRGPASRVSRSDRHWCRSLS
jgi:catechol 2,3-dioxygenase-like lactoylglutathione lyase family enzyme